jgi:hypothetical protein
MPAGRRRSQVEVGADVVRRRGEAMAGQAGASGLTGVCAGLFKRLAECNSAIQQSATLRYEVLRGVAILKAR